MRTLIGKEGGFTRVILCVSSRGFYLAVKPRRRYYRVSVFYRPFFRPDIYVGRS